MGSYLSNNLFCRFWKSFLVPLLINSFSLSFTMIVLPFGICKNLFRIRWKLSPFSPPPPPKSAPVLISYDFHNILLQKWLKQQKFIFWRPKIQVKVSAILPETLGGDSLPLPASRSYRASRSYSFPGLVAASLQSISGVTLPLLYSVFLL